MGAVPVELKDRILWYNVEKWGQLGYAVPNWGNNWRTNNAGIAKLVDAIGLNLASALRSTDAFLRKPPQVGTLRRINTMILRAREIVGYRAVGPAQKKFTGTHIQPVPRDFVIYPVPYWRIANGWLKEWAELTLSCLAELMQTSENVEQFDFSTDLGAMVGGYLQRIYKQMAVELLKVPLATVTDTYVISDADFLTYDPGKWFAPTEMLDLVPNLDDIPTEVELGALSYGIPASQIVGIAAWPTGDASGIGGPVTAAAAANVLNPPAFPVGA